VIKVLLIDNSVDTTGAFLALIKSANEVKGDDFDFIFIFPKGSRCTAEAAKAGFKTYEIGFIEISRRVKDIMSYLPVLIKNAFKVRGIIKRENIAIVHVNDIFNMIGLCIKAITKTKVITHVRRMPESFPGAIYKAWASLHVKFADRIIAVSEANKRGLPPNNKTDVVYDSLPEIQIYGDYRIKGNLNRQVNILYLANYIEGKGHQYALHVLKKAIDEFTGWQFHLDFFGGNLGLDKNNFYKESLVSLANDLSIDQFVSFNDKSSDVEKEMKAHDVLLNLSDSESFSRVTLEALYYGIPVVATNVGGTGEMLIDNKGGVLVKAKDVDEMYSGFKKLIADDLFRVSLSTTSYQFVRTHFDVTNTAIKNRKIYEDVLAVK
jgi:glycosyltransferase involved in cell wall biosynthesis